MSLRIRNKNINYNNINLIESSKNLIDLLSCPITHYFNFKEEDFTIYNKWMQYNLELYNNRSEFVLIRETSDRDITQKINSYKINYNNIKQWINFNNKSSVNKIFPCMNHIEYNCWENLHIYLNNCTDINYNNLDEITNQIHFNKIYKVTEHIDECIEYEKLYKNETEDKLYTIIAFVYEYLNMFDDKSINSNLWNYCLRSTNISNKYLFIGILTIICQYSWVAILLYNIIDDYNIDYDSQIIFLTIISTIISILYSYDTIWSFIHSKPLYDFILGVYDDFPEMVISESQQNNLYYKHRKINMNKYYLYWNYLADCLSNFVLPLLMPFINFFIVISSDSVLDAILNSVAIFFIIQIDEQLYTINSYENDLQISNFSRWLLAVIYNKINPNFEKDFKMEVNNHYHSVFKLAFELKNRQILDL